MRAAFVGVQEVRLVVGAGVPTSAVEQPTAGRQRSVLLLPTLDVLDLEQEVGVGGRCRGEIEHHRRRDQPTGRDRRHIVEVLPRDPVLRRVEVRAGVLAAAEVVPVPGRSALVVATDLLQREAGGLAELGRQLDDRRVRRQRRSQVDDVDGAAGEAVDQCGERAHRTSLAAIAGEARPRHRHAMVGNEREHLLVGGCVPRRVPLTGRRFALRRRRRPPSSCCLTISSKMGNGLGITLRLTSSGRLRSPPV